MFGAATNGLEPGDQGVGSGLVSTTQQIGGAVGLALTVAAAGFSQSDSAQAVTSGIQTAFWVALGLIGATVVIATGFRGRVTNPRTESGLGATPPEAVAAEA